MEDNIKFKKVEFIANNKEILKNCLMFKIDFNNESKMVIFLVLSILLKNEPLEQLREFWVLKEFTDNSIVLYNDKPALEDIIGNLKQFIVRFNGGTDLAEELLLKIDEYEDYINYFRFNEQKKYVKVAN